MTDSFDLHRFVAAQDAGGTYERALGELRAALGERRAAVGGASALQHPWAKHECGASRRRASGSTGAER